ncbi:short-chain fatty acyl-CoA regulator family protein [Limimaricola sp.]|uniref:short-chain fatty acyl-CoA regulator family protein n=1 Tax=Limimaricola sp. TaxID=2211665 RepID=UPI00405876FA
MAVEPGRRRLAGGRIRARRLDAGLAQADLARRVGISPSYLNLIEHDRRRIGGRLLNAIAQALGLEPAQIAEGAGDALIDRLGAAAAAQGRGAEDAEAFAGRFPDWAGLVEAQAARIEALEAQVAGLSDRLAHDPELSASLHQVITAATAIRSTASILVEGEALDRDWQSRFHNNIHAESLRLAESSRRLAGYLEAPGEATGAGALSPLDRVEAALDRLGHHVPALEGDSPSLRPAEVAAGVPGLDASARRILNGWCDTYRADAVALPLDTMARGWRETPEPLALAARLGCTLPRLLRRLASLPPGIGPARAGLVTCDAGGALGPRRALDGLTLPRGGAACPLWPLFEALSQPGRPLRMLAAMPGETAPDVLCIAVSTLETGPGWDAPPRVGAVMLMLPGDALPGAAPPTRRAVGPGCRLCPREGCRARREPPLLTAASRPL